MTYSTVLSRPILSGSLAEELRLLAEHAEISGDRVTSVRALKVAWLIEHRSPVHPVPPSPERTVGILERLRPLVAQFNPDQNSDFEMRIAHLRQCLVELAKVDREISTLH